MKCYRGHGFLSGPSNEYSAGSLAPRPGTHNLAPVPGALPLATVSPGTEEALGLTPTVPQR